MTLIILNSKEEKEVLEKLENQFGITKLPGIILKRGEERLFLYNGTLSKKEIEQLDKIVPIERAGIYFAKIQDDKIRLSIEGTHIFKDQISKNIFDLNEEQTNLWMHGSELLVEGEKKGFLVMKNKQDFFGCGKASSEKITNFIPKSRRLKFKS